MYESILNRLNVEKDNRLLVYDESNLLCEYDVQGTYSTGNQFVVLNLYIYNVIYAWFITELASF